MQGESVMIKTTIYAAALALTLAPAAFAQQGKMQGMDMRGHGMGGMDMQGMMNRCSQVRQQMRPGAKASSDMQRMMERCSQMDGQMGSTAGNSGRE